MELLAGLFVIVLIVFVFYLIGRGMNSDDSDNEETLEKKSLGEPFAERVEQAACPVCGATAYADDIFCAKCGNKIEIKPDTALTNCPACGAELREGADFCTKCGAMIAESAKRVCPVCGAEAAANDVYCLSCGKKLYEV